jgi:hypothetical protein
MISDISFQAFHVSISGAAAGHIGLKAAPLYRGIMITLATLLLGPLAIAQTTLQIEEEVIAPIFNEFMVRPSIHTYIGKGFTVGGGHGYARRPQTSEHRLFQQVVYKHWLLSHRARIEQRWNNGQSQQRLRLSSKITIPLSKLVSPVAYNEGLIVLDSMSYQNRAFVGIASQLNKRDKLEVGYLNMRPERGRTLHCIQATFTSTIRLRTHEQR